MRIVAGSFRGHGLLGPGDQSIRPTSDRLRETLFNILAHTYEDIVSGARVLDLFAGTGALGLEALSRGARFALFVDYGAAARAIIRTNIEALGLTGVTKLFRRDATRLGPAAPAQPYDLVFCDPPYGKGLGEKAITSALAGGWIADRGIVIVEERRDTPFVLPNGMAFIESRTAGDSQLLFLRPHLPSSSA